MKNRTAVRVVVAACGFLSLAVGACILPDTDIQVVVTDKCGEEWVASTVGAQGRNGLGQWVDIKTVEDDWVSASFCLTPASALELQDSNSVLYGNVYWHMVDKCVDRAIELQLGNNTCQQNFDVAYAGACAPSVSCEESTETGEDGSETETGESTDLGSLDLTSEVTVMRGGYRVSQLLIDTALADPVGLLNDGTTLTQVFDATGAPYGFEIGGVTSTNLGGALGLQNGDVLTEISGYQTATYDDLLDVAGFLFTATSANMELQRGTRTVVRTYIRGS